MAAPLVALAVENPQINALGAFSEGQKQAAGVERAKLEQAAATMQMIGSGAMYALGGDINGEVDPAKYAEVLDSFQGLGVDVSRFRQNPNFAKIAAQASVSALDRLRLARDDASLDLALRKFDADLNQFDQRMGMERETLDLQRQRLAQGSVPDGYRATQGGMEAIPGGPADPNNPLNTRKISGPNLSVTAQKEILEADEGVQSGQAVVAALDRALELNSKAYSGPMAETRGYAGSLVGMDDAVATEELKNLVTSQALDQLRATFGAMPTEGERKILLEIQGSVNQSPEVRKRIYERAKAAAERRVEFARQKAAKLRSGEYFSEGPGDAPASPAATPAQPGASAEITSQEAYDALPSGAVFMSGGKRYRKP